MSERAIVTAKTPETNRGNSSSQTKKTNFSQSIGSPIDQILFLQRTVGNQAVERLIKSGALQTKLTVGQVMRMPELSKAQRKGVSECSRNVHGV